MRLMALADRVVRFVGICASWGVFLIVAIIVYDVTLRFVFNSPTKWATEISIYLFVAVGYLAFGYALQKGAHVRVDIVPISLHLKGRTLAIHEVMTLTSALAFVGLLEYESIIKVVSLYRDATLSYTPLQLPLFAVWLPIPVGCGFLCVQFAVLLARQLLGTRRGEIYKQGGIGGI